MSLACVMTSGLEQPRPTREQALQQLAVLPLKQQKEIMEQAQLVRTQRKHEQRYNGWLDQLRAYVKAERGRTSELARHLGVRRQSIWRWINEPWSKFPAWAAVATIVWYYREAQANRPELVSPQADILELVSPQADNFVRRSADKLLETKSAPGAATPEAR